MTSLPAAVAGYARRLHAAVPGHHVASPLGAWMLVGLVAPAAEGVARQQVEDALGMPADDAADAVRALLADPHPAVASAVASWTLPGLDRPRYEAWAGGLPSAVGRGPLPDQAGLDAWAREHTLGLVERFPVTLRPDTAAVLASALATTVRWFAPYAVVDAQRLRSPWGDRVDLVLAASGPRTGVVPSAAGPVGVHVMTDEDDTLAVVSVVGAPEATRDEVLSVAHDLALAVAGQDPWEALPGAADPRDLPLGDGHAWTVSEEVEDVVHGEPVRTSVVLPAWEATTEVDLTADDRLGFGAAGGTLVDLLRPLPDPRAAARQSAVARYTASGFEAAAVTVAVAAGGGMPQRGVVRALEVRFARPYAVVAVATSGPVAWQGLPVFSAWVEEPAEAVAPELFLG